MKTKKKMIQAKNMIADLTFPTAKPSAAGNICIKKDAPQHYTQGSAKNPLYPCKKAPIRCTDTTNRYISPEGIANRHEIFWRILGILAEI